MSENRFCAFDDQPVEKMPEAAKTWTRDEDARGEFKHKQSSYRGVPNCGRQFLTESQTYTENDSTS